MKRGYSALDYTSLLHLTLHIQNRNFIGGVTKIHNPMLLQNSLGYYIRWFKGRSTNQIRREYPKLQFAWHPGYFDRIINNKKAFYAVKKYIRKNPANWKKKLTADL
jgi:hypothetical protein